MRQLLTEAVVLSLLGAALGVLLARLGIAAVLPLVSEGALLRSGGIVIDARVMAFCLGLSLLASVLVSLVPALRLSGSAFGEGRALHAGDTRAIGDRQGERLRTLLVSAQVAPTLVLLVGAGLLIHSFLRLTSVSPGFESSDEHGVVQTIRVTLPQRVYDDPARIYAFARGVLDGIQYLPGVQSASLINMMPFGAIWLGGEFEIEGQPKPTVYVSKPKIGAAYFKTMGIPLLAGREFTAQDTAAAPKVAIVSERILREYLPGGPAAALGRLVRLNSPGGSSPGDWLTVVGVVADIRQLGLDEEPERTVYIPFQQERDGFFSEFLSFVVRTSTPASCRRRRARGDPARRARFADREHGDDGGSGREVGGGAALPDAVAGALRDRRDTDRDVRHLRSDGLRRHAAAPRDWCAIRSRTRWSRSR